MPGRRRGQPQREQGHDLDRRQGELLALDEQQRFQTEDRESGEAAAEAGDAAERAAQCHGQELQHRDAYFAGCRSGSAVVAVESASR